MKPDFERVSKAYAYCVIGEPAKVLSRRLKTSTRIFLCSGCPLFVRGHPARQISSTGINYNSVDIQRLYRYTPPPFHPVYTTRQRKSGADCIRNIQRRERTKHFGRKFTKPSRGRGRTSRKGNYENRGSALVRRTRIWRPTDWENFLGKIIRLKTCF